MGTLALLLVPAGTAAAHPLGNFTVNRYDGLVIGPEKLRIDHVEDLAEIPATQAKPRIKEAGKASWARERCATAAGKSRVTVDGREVALNAGESRVQVRPGQAGLDTLRVECRWTAPLPEGEFSLGFRASVDNGPGWREVTARGDRMTLASSDVPTKSVSRELTSYPEELLQSPEDTATASLTVRPGGPALAEENADAPASSILPRGADRFTRALDDLVARHDLSTGFAALALVIAVGLGAMHALAPGHGKTLMAATAAARGGRAGLRDVLPLAASVTVTHTLGVVALGLLVTAGSAAAPSVVTWLGIASGVLVMAAGLTLVRKAWRARAHRHEHPPAPDHEHSHGHEDGHSHAHGHAHGHTHDHDHQPGHTHEHGDAHEHAERHERPLILAHAHAADGEARSSAPGQASALLEAPARTEPHPTGHHHEHTDQHDHSHAHGHTHGHKHSHGHKRTHAGAAHTHTHGGFTHTHEIAPTVRGTILLGFAGGLVPSPSAVVVLVGAAALGKAWFGFLLVLAYGVGLALTLTAAGVAVVKLGSGVSRLLENGPRWTGGPVATLVRRNIALGSAFVVVALGAGLVLQGAATALG
ncbi:HoxN/HupN/NixA family nickel/cobalt transporter [Streptomyces ureilyticus]|uniref:Nickel transporter n=1 Tax=Streptomyces ureilyticus TaxID=1775131 RepID=A0ABX0DTH5_9ACTN|nr:sulfite exporter TauE/SafE family protein [Streptomyces ureilyticus]NGO45186.1 nickel transporter [Streptomyces ureilyticus]